MGLHLDHVSITVADLARAAAFYDAALGALGIPCVWREPAAIGYGARSGPENDAHAYVTIRAAPTVAADRRHWCLRAPGRAAVDAFHAAALAHGGRSDGPPGPRPEYHAAYYAAFVLDPDGNRLEAACHRAPGAAVLGLDHLQLAMPAGAEDAARGFYGGLLGLREIPKPPPLAGRGGLWFALPPHELHLGVEAAFRPARKAHPALRVADLGSLAARLRAAGAAVEADASRPGVARAFTADPFGNRIELVEAGAADRARAIG